MFKIIFAICLFAAIAKGDTVTTGGTRVIENPISNGDIKLQVNKGSPKKDIIKANGTTGGVTLGTSATNNYNGPINAISGGLVSSNQTSGNQSGIFMVGANANYINTLTGLKGRTDTTQGGSAIVFDTYLDTTPGISFISNLQTQSLTTDAALNGSVTPEGTWTLGASGGTKTHVVHGRVSLPGSTGSIILQSSSGIYYASGLQTSGCEVHCGAADTTAGFNTNSGKCLAQWDNGLAPEACGEATGAGGNSCLCAGTN